MPDLAGPGHVRDVQQPVGPWEDLHEGPEVGNFHDNTIVYLSHLGFTDDLLDLGRFIARYYGCSLGEALAGRVACERADDLATAVASAAARVGAGETVLLSPACASFDQYHDFNARGDHFQDLVRALDG